MLIFGGHDSSQVNEFNDPMGGARWRNAVARVMDGTHEGWMKDGKINFIGDDYFLFCFGPVSGSSWLKLKTYSTRGWPFISTEIP